MEGEVVCTSSGIPFFPLDVTLDDKFRLIEAEFGITGFGVVVKIFQKIYGDQGYYIEWTKDVALLFSSSIREGRGVVDEIVSAAIRRGIFDETLHKKYGILTSKGIQERYLRAVERRKRVEVKKAYLLTNAVNDYPNVCISSENVSISIENADIPQESTGEDNKGDTPLPPKGGAPAAQEIRLDYQRIVDMFHECCPSQPKVKIITDKRKRAMRSAHKTLAEMGAKFKHLFIAIERSDFLSGRGEKVWFCGFDWALRIGNLVKIMEDTYPSKCKKNGGGDGGWKPG